MEGILIEEALIARGGIDIRNPNDLIRKNFIEIILIINSSSLIILMN